MSLSIGVILWGIAVGIDPPWLRPLRPYIGLLTLSILFYGLTQIFTHCMMRRQQFRLQMHSSWVQALTYVTIQLGGGVLRAGTVGLLAGQLAGQVVSTLMLGRGIRYFHIDYKRFFELANRYKYSSGYNLLAAFVYTLQSHLPIILSASFYSAKEVGWLALSLRVVATPVQMISTSLGRVYLSRAAELARQSPESLRMLVFRTLKLLFLLAVAPALVLSVVAPMLFAWLFGADWRTSGEYLQILAPMLLINLVVFPVHHTPTILNQPSVLFVIETLRMFLVFLSFWLPGAFNQPFQMALWAYSATYILTQLLLIGVIIKLLYSLQSRR